MQEEYKFSVDLTSTPVDATDNATADVIAATNGTDDPTDTGSDSASENSSDSSFEDESIRNEQHKANQPSKLKRTKTEKKRHPCTQCNRIFDHQSKLSMHIKGVHEGIRPHVCEQCGKCYKTPFEFKLHTRTHTGEKPYACDQCIF